MIKIPSVKKTSNDMFVCFGRTEYGIYAADTDEVIYKLFNDNFTVLINGTTCEVRECRVSAIPFNRPWPGKQRSYNQSESAGFISFSADEEVEIRVKSKKEFQTAIIRPLSKEVNTEICGDEVKFKLEEHGSYVLELDGTHNVLHIFFGEIKEYPDAENATYYFGPGMHFPGTINLHDNDTVYIDESATVFGSLNSLGAENVKIFGGGVIDNSCEERLVENAYENFTKGCFRIYNCKNVDVSDIILTNSSIWCMSMFNCKNIHIDNVKIVGQWRYNTDGIDIVNSEDVLVENCFIRSFDDTVSIKAIYNYDKPVQNITVDNCVMWCGWGKNCEIGIETAGIEYKNIIFRNCDLIHNSVGAMCISNGCHADIHDILFENINVEIQSDTMLEVVQRAENQKYDAYGRTMTPYLVKNSNQQYGVRQRLSDRLDRRYSETVGNIHDVRYRNIRVFTDNPSKMPIIIENISNKSKFFNFKFEDIYINGEKAVGFEKFNTTFKGADNITIK